jgi:hypothetical protein
MKTSTAFLFYLTWAMIAFVVYNEDYRYKLEQARINCEAEQVLNVIDYSERVKAGTWGIADPPSTYCGYLQKEQPQILLNYNK